MQQPFLWKRFFDASIDSYVGVANEPILDLRSGSITLKICDGVTPGGLSLNSEVDAGVLTPTVIGPTNGAVDISTSPILQASTFEGYTLLLEPDTLASSKWQIATDPTFANIIHDSGVVTNTPDVYDLDAASVVLVNDTQYYVRVKYVGASGIESSYSPISSFTTTLGIPTTSTTPFIGIGGDSYGSSVDISDNGDTVIIGASSYGTVSGVSPGRVYIHAKINGNWTLQAELSTPTPVLLNGTVNSRFGTTVCLSADGNTAAISAVAESHIHIYVRTGTTWTLQQTISPSGGDVNTYLGFSMEISNDGNVIAAGAPFDNSYNGAFYVFTRTGSTWSQQSRIIAPVNGRSFAYSVGMSTDGNTITGCGKHADTGINAWIYTRSGSTCILRESISIPKTGPNGVGEPAGTAVNGDGTVVVFGLPGNNAQTVSVYTRPNTTTYTWILQQTIQSPAGSGGNDYFGQHIGITTDGSMIAVAGWALGKIHIYLKVNATYTLMDTVTVLGSNAVGRDVTLNSNGSIMIAGDSSNAKVSIFTN